MKSLRLVGVVSFAIILTGVASAADVRVLQVRYAGQSGAGDFTSELIPRCSAHDHCSFDCSNGEFSDVDKHHPKYCYLKYACGDGPAHENTYPEGQKGISIDCRN